MFKASRRGLSYGDKFIAWRPHNIDCITMKEAEAILTAYRKKGLILSRLETLAIISICRATPTLLEPKPEPKPKGKAPPRSFYNLAPLLPLWGYGR